MSQLREYLFESESADKAALAALFSARKESSLSYSAPINGENSESKTEGSIAIIPITGVMRASDGLCNVGAATIASEFRAAYSDPSIVGIIADVRTGGGESEAAQIIRSAIKDRNKPVVALVTSAYSAGVYSTMDSDRILISDEFGGMGSVGCLYSMDKEVATFYKENVDEIYAKQSTEKNDAWRAYLDGNKKLYEEKASEFAQIFIDQLQTARGISPDAMREISTGKTFTATRSVELGLADQIGGMADAVSAIISLNAKSAVSNMGFLKTMREKLDAALNANLAEDADEATILATLDQFAPLAGKIEGFESKLSAIDGFESKLGAFATTEAIGALESKFDEQLLKFSQASESALAESKSSFGAALETVKADAKAASDAKDARLAALETALAELSAKPATAAGAAQTEAPQAGLEKFNQAATDSLGWASVAA